MKIAQNHPETNNKRSASISAACKTPETYAKRSRAAKKRWKDGVFDTERYRKLRSEAMRKAWASGAYGESYRRKQSEHTKQRWENGEFIPFQNPSKLALSVNGVFKSLGYETELEYLVSGLAYDIFVPKLNLLCEVDGDYWHHSEQARRRGVPERDKQKTKLAKDQGFVFVRIRERCIKSKGPEMALKEQLIREGIAYD